MSISPSQAIRQILINQNLATDSLDADWRCVLLRLPDGIGVRDNILAVSEIEGGVGDRYISTGEIITQPKVRILCRSTSYHEGYSLMMQICDLIDTSQGCSVTINPETVVIHQISRSSGIMPSGLDSTMRRYHFSLDYEVHLR